MVTLLAIICLGFFLGMRHATDADHVIAVTTIVSRERSIRAAAWIGVVWGLGHTLTVVAVGGAIVLFGLVIPPRLGMSLEFSVALMLIGLGVWNLKGLSRSIGLATHEHVHPHQHGDYVHAHRHSHHPEHHTHTEQATPQGWLDRRFGKWRLYPTVRPLIVGVVHGLAGSAAVALLVLPIIQNPLWAVAYLLVFGVGTIAGMMLITATIALPITYTVSRSATFHRRFGLVSGLVSIGFGLFMIYEIGFVQGLFR
jgi:high-affinity nickel-transport protein